VWFPRIPIMGYGLSMTRLAKPLKESYTELEAADYLKITVEELHAVLDRHIFNDGCPRPNEITFCESDLVLLGFWARPIENPKVISMPRRS
jgi:hypothetical protein